MAETNLTKEALSSRGAGKSRPDLRRVPASEDDQPWLVSYSDLMTLLMTFFVLLISISAIDLNKYQRVVESITSAVGEENRPRVTLEALYREINKMIEEEWLKEEVRSEITPLGVAINVPGAFLFESGEADVSSQALPLLGRLSELIREVPYQVAVEGHTDDVPINSEKFPSNWELSSARASGIVRLFIQQDVPATRLRAIGFADTQPIATNIDLSTGQPLAENRARNRRVVIRFLAF